MFLKIMLSLLPFHLNPNTWVNFDETGVRRTSGETNLELMKDHTIPSSICCCSNKSWQKSSNCCILSDWVALDIIESEGSWAFLSLSLYLIRNRFFMVRRARIIFIHILIHSSKGCKVLNSREGKFKLNTCIFLWYSYYTIIIYIIILS